MSPATPLDTTTAYAIAGELTLRVPRLTRFGLELLAVIAWPDSAEPPDFEALGWTELGTATGALGSIALLRRAASSDEPATYGFTFGGVIAEALPIGALIVATGVASSDEASDVESTDIEDGGPTLEAPSALAGTYSDACLHAFYLPATSVDTEFGPVPVFAENAALLTWVTGEDDSVPGALAIAWQMPEQAGPTGTFETDTNNDPIDALVATFTLQAQPPAIAPRWDEDGTSIGLPTVGV